MDIQADTDMRGSQKPQQVRPQAPLVQMREMGALTIPLQCDSIRPTTLGTESDRKDYRQPLMHADDPVFSQPIAACARHYGKCGM